MVRIAVFPILLLAVLGVIVIVAAIAALVSRSPKRKWFAIVPIAAVSALVALGGVLAAVLTSAEHGRAVEQRLLDQQAVAMRDARDEVRIAYQSQVLDYRGDTSEPVVVDTATGDNAPSIEVIRYSPNGSQADQPLSELPDWVADHHEFDPVASQQTLVLSSEPWSSVEEADEELYAKLAVRAGDILSADYPEADGWYPSREAMNALPFIQDAVRERVPLEVGEHVVHVQHAHWQVELTPQIRQQLFELWRPTLVQDRLVKLGGGFGAATLLFALAAGILRFQSRRTDRSLARMS